jgi:hypothetical protein
MKKCNVCDIEKSLDKFVKRANRPNGFQAYCKECHNKKMRLKDNKEYMRNFDLKKSYGITINDYNKMFNEQYGCCAICKIHILELGQKIKKHLCVDHNHETGQVRGLLCDKCNRGIGLLQDNKDVLLNAYNYLDKF